MGGYTEVRTPLRRIKGSLRTLTMNERMSADKKTVFATHRFYCHYSFGKLDITEDYEFIDDKQGRVFQISSTNDLFAQQNRLEIDLLEID